MIVVRKFFAAVCCLGLFAFVPANADSTNVASMLSGVGKNAITGYAQPLVTTLGTGMNSGWYTSAKPLAMFGKLPVGISIGVINVPFVVIDNSMKTFNFTGDIPSKSLVNGALPSGQDINSIYNALQAPDAQTALAAAGIDPNSLGVDSLIKFEARGQPTIFGPDSARKIPLDSFLSPGGHPSKTLNTIKAYNYIQSLSGGQQISLGDSITLPFKGIGNIISKMGGMMFSLPSVGIELGSSKIPVIGNLTLGLRMIPDIDLKKMSSNMPFSSVGLFGFKVQYEYLHLIPFASTLPIKSSVMFAENSFHLGKSADTVYLNQSNWMMALNASADAHWGVLGAGLFTGVGYEKSSLDVNVKLHEIDSTLSDFSVTIPGKNNFRFTIGPRINIAFLEIFGAANFGTVTSYNVGVTILGFNGRGL